MFSTLLKDKKTVKIAVIVIGVLLGIILLIVAFKSVVGDKISYSKIENVMVRAAENYFESKPELLPADNFGETKIYTGDLVSAGYMKEIVSYTKDNSNSCSGYVVVIKNDESYKYVPKLDCGSVYKTKSLVDVMTSVANIVSEGKGLYSVNSYYIYRGEVENNYASYAGQLWRIIKVNGDGTIRMIQAETKEVNNWDDRYNIEKDTEIGINNFEVSRIKEKILEIYNGKEVFSDSDKAILVPQKLCIGKRGITVLDNTGAVECSVMTVDYMPVGLLQLNEYALASLDKNCVNVLDSSCSNYNYLANLSKSFWTLTANDVNTYSAYSVAGSPFSTQTTRLFTIKLVVTISGTVNYTEGTGTYEAPYIIK